MNEINELQKDLEKSLENIPEKFLRSFTKRSIRDARQLIGKDFQIEDGELSEIAYTIYRAYCIGFVVGNIKTVKK